MEDLLTEQAVADYLRIKLDTLRRMRRRGVGPEYVRISPQRVMYKASAVANWINLRGGL